MEFSIASLAGLVGAYLLGATPSGYLAGRLLKGIDIRLYGSGSTGATNVLRILGKWPALAVFAVDLAKGMAAIWFARWFYPWICAQPAIATPAGLDAATLTPWAVCLTGLVVVLGHSRSVWLRFTGGKSAATGLGVLAALAWPVGLGAASVVVVTLIAFRIMSLSSMAGALASIALIWALPEPEAYRALVITGGVYVIWLHRANIGRLLAGREPRLGKAGPGV